MFEVYNVARPGRPVLLLLMSLGLLCGTLGLAWRQVYASRALGPEQGIAGTPLLIRAPRDWVPDRSKPGTFVLPFRRNAWSDDSTIERRVSFRYLRLPVFRPPADLVRDLDLVDSGESRVDGPARVGPFEGLQVRRRKPFRYLGRIQHQELVLRLACSPRGEAVIVEYLPLTDLTAADLALLDDLCSEIRLQEGAPVSDVAALLRTAGLEISSPPGVSGVRTDIAETPGCYLGFSQRGTSTWSLAIFRSWLAVGRTPRDLLVDFAAAVWEVPTDALQVRQESSADGTLVASLRHPAVELGDSPVPAVYVISKSANETAVVMLCTGKAQVEDALRSADATAAGLRFVDAGAWPDTAAAAAAGGDLRALFSSDGPSPWWGRDSSMLFFRGETPRGSEVHVMQRAAQDRNPEGGYRGAALWLYGDRRESEDWTLNGKGAAYTYRYDGLFGSGRNALPLVVRERRASADDAVSRTIGVGRDRRTVTYTPSAAFICPPIEDLAAAWVARQPAGVWIIEVSARLGPRTHTQLLRPLTKDADGRSRVLRQSDFLPMGEVWTYDDKYELVGYKSISSTFDRIDESEAVRRFPNLLRDLRPKP